jgi:hypothetical protein
LISIEWSSFLLELLKCTIFKLKGNLLFESQKLVPTAYMWLIHINWGPATSQLIVRIQSANSGNRFATYVSVQGIGLSLLFKQIGSSVPKSPLSANSGMAI